MQPPFEAEGLKEAMIDNVLPPCDLLLRILVARFQGCSRRNQHSLALQLLGHP